MQRAPLIFAATASLLALACSAGGSPTNNSGPGVSDGSGSSGESSTGEGPGTTVVAEGSGEASTAGPLDDTTGSEGSSSSSEGGCTPGTQGCSCDAGGCVPGLTCLAGVCEAAQCDGDVFETNESEDQATDLGQINDNDSNGAVVAGSLHSVGDVDWYFYLGDDDFTGNVDPARSVVASGGLRLCKFIECDNGLAETEFECPAGSQYALSPMARPGCCSSGSIELPDLNCTGVSEDNSTVYIRVDQPDEACVTYAISYHY